MLVAVWVCRIHKHIHIYIYYSVYNLSMETHPPRTFLYLCYMYIYKDIDAICNTYIMCDAWSFWLCLEFLLPSIHIHTHMLLLAASGFCWSENCIYFATSFSYSPYLKGQQVHQPMSVYFHKRSFKYMYSYKN